MEIFLVPRRILFSFKSKLWKGSVAQRIKQEHIELAPLYENIRKTLEFKLVQGGESRDLFWLISTFIRT